MVELQATLEGAALSQQQQVAATVDRDNLPCSSCAELRLQLGTAEGQVGFGGGPVYVVMNDRAEQMLFYQPNVVDHTHASGSWH